MAKNVPRDRGPDPVVILATAFVIAGGLASCVGIVFISTTDPTMPLLILGSCIVGYCLLMWLLGPKRSDFLASIFKRSPKRAKVTLKFHRHKPNSRENTVNGPPTAESIREMKINRNIWVPTKHPPHSAPDVEPES